MNGERQHHAAPSLEDQFRQLGRVHTRRRRRRRMASTATASAVLVLIGAGALLQPSGPGPLPAPAPARGETLARVEDPAGGFSWTLRAASTGCVQLVGPPPTGSGSRADELARTLASGRQVCRRASGIAAERRTVESPAGPRSVLFGVAPAGAASIRLVQSGRSERVDPGPAGSFLLIRQGANAFSGAQLRE